MDITSFGPLSLTTSAASAVSVKAVDFGEPEAPEIVATILIL